MHRDIIRFWFEEVEEKQWWKKDSAFDALIARRFGAVHQQAQCCELYTWRDSSEGRLAEIIILDQFSRNLHRGSPLAYANDSLALALAQEAVSFGDDRELEPRKRQFIYMPYMHSESRLIHEVAEQLFAALGQKNNWDYEKKHKAIIDRFGRYPHRNDILGRESSREEIEFLQQGGSRF